jgi:hypothetical protein
MSDEPRQLIADQATRSQPVFADEQAYQQFRLWYYQQVKPELDRQEQARRRSEERAKQYLLG